MIFCVFNFIFRLEPTVREQLDEDNFRHYHGLFFESTILNLLDHIIFFLFFTITYTSDKNITTKKANLRIENNTISKT